MTTERRLLKAQTQNYGSRSNNRAQVKRPHSRDQGTTQQF